MRQRLDLQGMSYVVACAVFAMGLFTVVRVGVRSQYSTAPPPPEPGSNKLVETWDKLEGNFQERQKPGPILALGRDPLWPTYVARTASRSQSPAPRADVASEAMRNVIAPPPPPPQQPPRVIALLLGRERSAMLQHEGRSRLVRAGDRIGPVHVLDVSPAGVTVEWHGVRRLLRMRGQ